MLIKLDRYSFHGKEKRPIVNFTRLSAPTREFLFQTEREGAGLLIHLTIFSGEIGHLNRSRGECQMGLSTINGISL